MPIDKVTASQFATALAAGIQNRDVTIDTGMGPVVDTVISPLSAVLEKQNDRARKISLLFSLTNADEFTGYEADLEGIVSNEGELRSQGAPGTTSLVFATTAVPSTDLKVARGFPVGSSPDTSTNSTTIVVATEDQVLPVAAASSFFNPVTQQYELTVPVVATSKGTSSQVGPNRINRPLRPLVGFSSVTNPSAMQNGTDPETNAQLISRYRLAILGRQTGVVNGIIHAVKTDFPSVQDIAVVYGTDPLLTRAGDDAGAVDAYLLESASDTQTDILVYPGPGILMAITAPPLLSVTAVASGGVTFTEGVSYQVVFDDSGVSGSVREQSGIVFLAGAGSLPASLGVAVTVSYTYDSLVPAVQTEFDNADDLELGRDLLFRRSTSLAIVHTAQLRALSGFTADTLIPKVQAALATYQSTQLLLGQPVQISDIQAVARSVPGIDNYIITRLTPANVSSGVEDILVGENQHAVFLPTPVITAI